MDVHLHLYSILRDKLPAEAKGRTLLTMDENATLGDIIARFDLPSNVVVSVNGTHQNDFSLGLEDGDVVKIFSSVGGG